MKLLRKRLGYWLLRRLLSDIITKYVHVREIKTLKMSRYEVYLKTVIWVLNRINPMLLRIVTNKMA